jgi:hypothetical protein
VLLFVSTVQTNPLASSSFFKTKTKTTQAARGAGRGFETCEPHPKTEKEKEKEKEKVPRATCHRALRSRSMALYLLLFDSGAIKAL